MSDLVTEIFGYIVIVTAIALFLWEYFAFKNRTKDDYWLITTKRKNRRNLIALLVFLVGLLILLETKKIINIGGGNINGLIFYVLSLTGLAVTLIVLAIRDVSEMADNAQKLALKELHDALEKKDISNEQDTIDGE